MYLGYMSTTQIAKGQRIACKCGGNHGGTVVHVISASRLVGDWDSDLLGVCWDDNTVDSNDATFGKVHRSAGDHVSIKASAVTADSLTVEQAYDKGWRSSLTNVDWDVAAERFDAKYGQTYVLRVAWMDGWSDRILGHRKGHALRCPRGLTLGKRNGNFDGHGECLDGADV